MNGGADFSDIVNKLTENPETLKKLMSVAGNLFADDRDADKNIDHSDDRRREHDNRGEFRADNGCDTFRDERQYDEHRRHDREDDRRFDKHGERQRGHDAENLVRLLIALKPYVSDDRCSKIDSIIKILKLVQLSEKTGLLKSFL